EPYFGAPFKILLVSRRVRKRAQSRRVRKAHGKRLRPHHEDAGKMTRTRNVLALTAAAGARHYDGRTVAHAVVVVYGRGAVGESDLLEPPLRVILVGCGVHRCLLVVRLASNPSGSLSLWLILQ